MFRSRLHIHSCAMLLLLLFVLLTTTPTNATTTILMPTLIDGIFEPHQNDVVNMYALGLSYAASTPAGSIVSYSMTSTWGASSVIFSSFSSLSTSTNALALFGPAGTNPVNMLMQSLPADTNLMLFSPLAQPMWTSPAKGNAYLPFVMFTMPSEGSQAAALMTFFASFPQFPLKQLIVTTSSNGIGNAAYAVLSDLLKRVDVTLSRATSASQYTSMVASAPQLIYMVGQTPSDTDKLYYTDTNTWATNVLADKTLGAANTSLGFTFEMFSLMYTAILATFGSTAPAKGSGVLPENEFHTSPFPGSTSTEYQVSTDFQAAQGTSTNPAWQQDMTMAGWVYGTALMTSFAMYSGPPATSRETYFDNFVAAQSGFLVSDLFIGSYGPSSTSCSSLAEAHGAVCACHQAGVNTFMSTFTRSGSTYDTTDFPNFVFQYGLSGCGSIYPVAATSEPYVKFLQSLFRQQLIGFNTQDNTEVSSMCDEVMQGLSSFGHVVTSCISTTLTSAGTALGTQLSTYVTNGLMGVIPDAAVASASLGSTFVLDFIPETTQPLVSQANLVYLFSTLDQELYVLASYLLGILTPTSVVCGVVGSSSSADATVALLSKTLTTFTITTEAGNVQKLASGSLGSSIPVGCTHTFVIGVGTGDAAGILTYLQTNADAKVMMSFDDLTKWYSAFQSALSGAPSSVTNRLIFATSLPSWTDMSETFGSLTVPANLPATPAAVRAYIVGLVYTTLCAGASWGSMSSVQAALYASRVLNAGNMKFGPFTTSLSDGSESLQNYGAQGISVWSYTRVTTPTTGTLTAPSVPAMHYFAGATTGSAVDVVKAANGENCVVAPDESSSLGNTPVVTTAPEPSATPPGGSSTTKLPSPGSTNNGTEKKESSSSHESDALEYVMAILAVLILVFVVLIVLLHLAKRGAFAWLSECMTSMLCSEPLMKEWKDAEKVRTAIDKDRQVDVVQQGVARDPSQAPVDGLLTFVFVEVEQWRELWLGQAEVMARAVRHLHGCVRGAVARNHCYEMQTVEGMFVVACSSAEAGLEVACCIVKEAAELLQRDADVVSAVYAALKCNPGGVRGLRLRVAVHHGTAMKSVDARGRVQWTGGAVDRVVSAAYEAGSAGVVLVTAAAVAALADAGCQRRDEIVPLKRTDAAGDSSCDTDLYVLNVLPGAVCRTEKPSVATGVEASVARAIVTAGAAHGQHSAAVAVCTKRFDAYFGSLSDGERSRSLRWIPRCCGLLVASRDECASDHEYYAELQTCVSRHVASLLECLHHASRGSSLSWKPSSDGRGLEGAPSVTQKSNVAGVVERVAIQSERRVRRSANRVHFSYDGEHADLEDTREMEN